MGAIGATEAYGNDYVLPNDGYCETCASVAYGFFSHYLTSAHGQSDYADAVELEMYNSILGCANLEGNKFFYKNPLNVKNHNRWDWHVCACCPPMLLKFYSQMQKYIYSYGEGEVYINQFISSKAKLGNGVEITQTSNMPWNGKVQIKTSKDIKLKIRIPDWLNGQKPKLTINNKSCEYEIDGGYAVVNAKSTDAIIFEMAMKPRKIYAENVVFNKGKVALGYGPIIYTFETTDNPAFADSAKEFSRTLQKSGKLSVAFEKDLLGGICTLSTTAIDKSGKRHTVKAIPYYLRGNRGSSGQYVWVPEK